MTEFVTVGLDSTKYSAATEPHNNMVFNITTDKSTNAAGKSTRPHTRACTACYTLGSDYLDSYIYFETVIIKY